MLIGSTIFAFGIVQLNMNFVFYLSLIIVATGTYAIRALYFSIMQEGRIPLSIDRYCCWFDFCRRLYS